MTTPMLTVRELGPHDGAVLDTVFAGLSTLSRFRRFHGAMPRMPSSTRTLLAAVDGRRHMALGAFAGPEPVGIARLVVRATVGHKLEGFIPKGQGTERLGVCLHDREARRRLTGSKEHLERERRRVPGKDPTHGGPSH